MEELLKKLVEQNSALLAAVQGIATRLDRLERVEEILEEISFEAKDTNPGSAAWSTKETLDEIKNQLEWADPNSSVGQILDTLNWTSKNSTAQMLLQAINAVESAVQESK